MLGIGTQHGELIEGFDLPLRLDGIHERYPIPDLAMWIVL
jgi:hypothetical protein